MYTQPDPVAAIFSAIGLMLAAIFVIMWTVSAIRIAKEYERAVVLRFGKYVGTRGPGLFVRIPIVEQIIRVDLRVFTLPVERQELISKDNVPVQVNAVVWGHVVNPEKSVLSIEDVRNSINQLSATQLRVTLGQYSLETILKDQDTLAEKMKRQIDLVTEPWGVQIDRVEMKNIEIPKSMQRVMAQEAEAGREKLARVIKADAELEASKKLSEAARIIAENSNAMELRRLQTITEVGAEQNTMVIVALPMDVIGGIGALGRIAQPKAPDAILPEPAPFNPKPQ